MHVTAHISDLHIGPGPEARHRLAAVMGYLNGLVAPIDAVLVTGDIADHGDPEEYRAAVALLDSRWPVLACPGNHDDRDNYRRHLADVLTPAAGDPAIGGAPVNRAVAVGEIRFLLCDSTVPGSDHGRLGDDTVEWLDAELSAHPDRASYLAFHHSPARLGYSFVDEQRQFDEQRLAALLDRHPQVIAVLAGHSHTAAATRFAGRPLLLAGGVRSTSNLPWESERPVDGAAIPVVAFHLADRDGTVVTHYRAVLLA